MGSVGLDEARVHDLKHTFGHHNSNIKLHYAANDLGRLIEAANKVCDGSDSTKLSVILRRKRAV